MSPAWHRTRVKICGITRLQDLLAAVEAGADALGFVFARRSHRVLKPAQATPLVAATPAFVSRVGLFMDQDFEEVARILDRVPLNLLQFHGGESAEFCRQFGLPYIKSFGMAALAASAASAERALQQAAHEFSDAAALLFDSHGAGETGGTGRRFDWGLLPRLARPVVLAGGLTLENVREAVRQVRPWAVDVSSGVEDAPGMKSPAKMQAFIREAKSEY